MLSDNNGSDSFILMCANELAVSICNSFVVLHDRVSGYSASEIATFVLK